MAKKQAFVTPLMEVRYAILSVPSTNYRDDGEWSIKVAVKDETPEAEYLKDMLVELQDKLIPKATADLKPAQKKKLIQPLPLYAEENPEDGEETGYLVMNFKMPYKVTRKSDGETFELYPNLYDAANNFIPKDVRKSLSVGAGSLVRVSFTCDRAYCMEGQGENGKFYKAGISCDLKAVKIIKLVAGGATAEGDGFGDDDHEEGFDASSLKPVKPEAPTSDFDKEENYETDGDF